MTFWEHFIRKRVGFWMEIEFGWFVVFLVNMNTLCEYKFLWRKMINRVLFK